ncbi:MAG: hypothetical protein L0Z62_17870, partial [Gemmataceae bacterium]|nr:hypothetical protein [Gemmataceae bacterium]
AQAEDKQKPRDQGNKDSPPKPVEPPPGQGAHLITSEETLRTALASPATYLHLKLADTVRISEGGLIFRGKEEGKGERTLLIESEKPTKPALLLIRPPQGAEREPGVPWGGLELNGGTVTFRNLHFEIQAESTPTALLAAVLVKGARSVTFKNCLFTQVGVPLVPLIPKRRLAPVASVATWNLDNAPEKPLVVFRECYFRKGQTAVAIRGAADLDQAHCAFGPHVCLFHLRGEENPKLGTHVRLKNVSALLVHGPAFRLDNDATCELTILHSIFDCPDSGLPDRPADPTALIYQTDTEKRSVLRFEGRRNCYHNLHSLWARRPANQLGVSEGWEDFRAALGKLEKKSADESSSYLTSDSPWREPNPLALLETDPARAFHINLRLAAVRQEDPNLPLGVEKCEWGAMYRDELPELPRVEPIPVVKRKANEKVVDPKSDGNSPGVFKTLQAAIAEAEEGDVILIKHTGLVPIYPISLKVGLRLTLRPDSGYRPVLTLAEKTVETEAALFTLYQGQLQMENLEFRLRPDREEFKSQTVVALGGNGQLSFKQCVVTLDLPQESSVALNAVTLFETKDASKMAMSGSRAFPEVHLQQCFVRGEGDLLFVRPSRPFELKLDGSLAALHNGSLVHIEGSMKDTPGGGAVAKVDLNKTTTYLGDHLIVVRPGTMGKGAAFTQVKAFDCLLVAGSGRPLVYLDGPGSEEQAKRVFGWYGERNSYAGYEVVLEQQPAGEGAMPQRFKQDDWKRLTNEMDQSPQFLEGRFEVAPPAERPLSQAVPSAFRFQPEPQVEVQGSGAALDQLPRPGAPEKAAPLPAPPEGRPPGDVPDDETE